MSTPAPLGVAVVTGASRGLGAAIARHLAEAGCDLVLNYRERADAITVVEAEVAALGRGVAVVKGDVADADIAGELADAAERLGTLRVWVNNAGVSVLAPVIETAPEDVQRMLEVNVMGVFHGLRTAAVHMRAAGTPGRIINVASEAGVQAFPLLGAYSASKFAVVGLSQAAALELAPDGITVNAVCPGTAETDMVLAERASEVSLTSSSPEEVRSAYLANIPAGRFCDPDDVGALVAFLATPASSYITGQSLCTNGGSVLH